MTSDTAPQSFRTMCLAPPGNRTIISLHVHKQRPTVELRRAPGGQGELCQAGIVTGLHEKRHVLARRFQRVVGRQT